MLYYTINTTYTKYYQTITFCSSYTIMNSTTNYSNHIV